jgi:putative selenate reductase
MSDRFGIVPFCTLTSYLLRSLEQGRAFGIYDSLFFAPSENDPFKTKIFGQPLDTPLGPAAGPHTQMAQNIVSAWLCGARYIELKTVQTLDDITVSKPCIDIQDEGYNCEWSQELNIEESFTEYLKAWILIHLLHHKFKWPDPIGTVFNMSVGYDMAGILKENVQWFFEKMADCQPEKEALLDEIRDMYPGVDELNIPDCMSNNITLSTMHGCPPDEIEKIGTYLLEEKKLHTYIKLNPTLLGPNKIRDILNKLGYETKVPDGAFEHDITWDAAKKVIRSLKKSSEKTGLQFGVKLTNTLEALNHKDVFTEDAMYMSGKALHPLSINVAAMVRQDFPNLPISFCAGVTIHNIQDVLSCGFSPVTVCSDLLKPGGYGRLSQYVKKLGVLPDLYAPESLAFLTQYAREIAENPLYQASYPNIKTERELKHFDCIAAPCVGTCPANQNIPEYMFRTAHYDLPNAFRAILGTNPFPSVTGMVCDHLCQTKCTRINYENALLIRDIKRFVAENAPVEKLIPPSQKNGKKVAIIGAGPSGLACAYFLILSGFDVVVYETKTFPGGMPADAIPTFRLSEKALHEDIRRIEKLGVKIHTSQTIDRDRFESIRGKSDFVYIAVGAQKSLKVSIPGDNVHEGILDPLEFLSAVRQGKGSFSGKQILVLGGGNTAMDAARTAKRLAGKDGNVTLVYRRTRREMPADQDEIMSAVKEGIELIELAAPEKILSEKGQVTGLVCSRMKLGEKDVSGRPRPEKIPGSEFTVKGDTLIPAFGQERVIDFIPEKDLEIRDPETREIQLDHIFIGGDAYRGASTIIKAIGDGRRTAKVILKRCDQELGTARLTTVRESLTHREHHKNRARIIPGVHPEEIPLEQRDSQTLVELTLTQEQAQTEASRCLLCDEVCDICVTVCPNRANISYTVEPFEIPLKKILWKNNQIETDDDGLYRIRQPYQILNIQDFCNECGNCTTFCPTSGAPYKDKPNVALTEESFRQMEEGFFLKDHILRYKKEGEIFSLTDTKDAWLFEGKEFSAILDQKSFEIRTIDISNTEQKEVRIHHAVTMSLIMKTLKNERIVHEAR